MPPTPRTLDSQSAHGLKHLQHFVHMNCRRERRKKTSHIKWGTFVGEFVLPHCYSTQHSHYQKLQTYLTSVSDDPLHAGDDSGVRRRPSMVLLHDSIYGYQRTRGEPYVTLHLVGKNIRDAPSPCQDLLAAAARASRSLSIPPISL